MSQGFEFSHGLGLEGVAYPELHKKKTKHNNVGPNRDASSLQNFGWKKKKLRTYCFFSVRIYQARAAKRDLIVSP